LHDIQDLYMFNFFAQYVCHSKVTVILQWYYLLALLNGFYVTRLVNIDFCLQDQTTFKYRLQLVTHFSSFLANSIQSPSLYNIIWYKHSRASEQVNRYWKCTPISYTIETLPYSIEENVFSCNLHKLCVSACVKAS